MLGLNVGSWFEGVRVFGVWGPRQGLPIICLFAQRACWHIAAASIAAIHGAACADPADGPGPLAAAKSGVLQGPLIQALLRSYIDGT